MTQTMTHTSHCPVPGCGRPTTHCITTPREAPVDEHWDACEAHRDQVATSVDGALAWDLAPVVRRLAGTPADRRDAEHAAWQREAS